MADKSVAIAVILSAYDRMTAVINSAVNRANAKLKTIQDTANKVANKSFAFGREATMIGAAAAATLYGPVKAFSELEDAGMRLKSVMMRDGGIIPQKLFDAVNKQAIVLGNKLPGTTADFQNLYATMLEQGTPAEAILRGTGKAAAYLAVQLRMPGEQAAVLASRMRSQMGIADNEMMKFMDIMARIKNVGVDPTEMQYAFGRSAGAMKLLNVQGLQASKTLGTLYAMLIRNGATGETAGTGVSKIMNELMNPTKMEKFQRGARAMGLQFEFFRNGKFLGMENFVAQLTKFQGMDPEKITKLLMPLTGGDGMDNQFLASLSKLGASGFNKMSTELSRQATLQQKVDVQLTSLKNKWEAASGTFTNSLAAFGGTFAPVLKSMADSLNRVSERLQGFISKHPVMFKYIGLAVMLFATVAIAAGGLAFVIGGVARSVALFAQAWRVLGIAIKFIGPIVANVGRMLLANPILLAIAAVAVAALLIYKYWGPIKGFFGKVWEGVKSSFRMAWDWIKYFFFNFTPHGLIIKHWGKIMQVGQMFFNAGKNIAVSLWNGMKAMAHKPVEAIKSIVTKIRRFLPFSPAKEGPLTDIHRIKLIETIAGSIKANPMISAMKGVMGQVMNYGGGSGLSISGGGSGAPVFNFTINLSGGATSSDAAMISREVKKAVQEALRTLKGNKERVGF